MERIAPVDAPEDDEQPKRPERFSPYAVPLSTLVASAYVSQSDQHVVVPDQVSPMRIPVGPEGGDGD
ncbi:MAG: hypothetical protein ACT4QF_14290 [Sporichthyaceae bacterium]